MWKKVLESKIMEVIGEYGIVKSKEQEYLPNGSKNGKVKTWYDVCLDEGDGDIVVSCTSLKEARQWAKDNL